MVPLQLIKAMLSVFAALFVLIPFCCEPALASAWLILVCVGSVRSRRCLFFFSFGSADAPAAVTIFIVKERSIKAKHLQFVSGVSINSTFLLPRF
jgi:hypothetical protein